MSPVLTHIFLPIYACPHGLTLQWEVCSANHISFVFKHLSSSLKTMDTAVCLKKPYTLLKWLLNKKYMILEEKV